MNKHQLQVVPFPGHMPSKKVTFRCRHCVARLEIERSVMESLLTKQDDRLVGVGFTVWGECHGR